MNLKSLGRGDDVSIAKKRGGDGVYLVAADSGR